MRKEGEDKEDSMESSTIEDFLQGTFPMTATTLFGLEDTLAQELEKIGATEVTPVRRAVTFKGDKATLYRANYRLRCALRVLVPLLSFEAKSTDDLYNGALHFDWHKIMPIGSSFFIDTAVFSSTFTNSRYALYRVKDAIRDFDRDSAYPFQLQAADSRRAEICLHLHISETQVTISLDSSGESLHHRGYRKGYNVAPLNEVLAAGMLLMAGYDGSTSFFDPMCGSGTLPIEAAMIASDTPAGYYRHDFGFKHWLNYDRELWESIREETQRKAILKPIIAKDRDFKVIGIATSNIINASFRRSITIEQADFIEAPAPVGPLLIMTNPPYGKRVTHENLLALYEGIGKTLKHRYAGSTAWILASPASLFHPIGLAPNKKIKLFNGDLECELRKFTLFEGSKKEFVTRKKNPLEEDSKKRSFPNQKIFLHNQGTDKRLSRSAKPFDKPFGKHFSSPRKEGEEAREGRDTKRFSRSAKPFDKPFGKHFSSPRKEGEEEREGRDTKRFSHSAKPFDKPFGRHFSSPREEGEEERERRDTKRFSRSAKPFEKPFGKHFSSPREEGEEEREGRDTKRTRRSDLRKIQVFGEDHNK